MTIKEAAQLFADWCHRVGELNPRPVTLKVWLGYNAPLPRPDYIDDLVWNEFVRIWTTYRRIA